MEEVHIQGMVASVVGVGIGTAVVVVGNILGAHSSMVAVEEVQSSPARPPVVVSVALLELASLSIYQALKAVLQ